MYVTHDQLEAMQMGDKIVVMNNAVVEQFGTPQDIYDKPATLFVADFIGSPSMNFLNFEGHVVAGHNSVNLGSTAFAVPQQLESSSGSLVLGVRPEHIALSDNAPLRAQVLAVEYLGTTQIVLLQSDYGNLKARVDSSLSVAVGDQVGVTLNADTITLFNKESGNAIRSVLNEVALSNSGIVNSAVEHSAIDDGANGGERYHG